MTRSLPHLSGRAVRTFVFAAMVGPILWAVHLVTGYALVSVGCQAGLGKSTMGGVHLITALVLLLTLVLVVITAIGAWLAYRHWREGRPARDEGEEARGVWNADAFMALFGALLSAYFIGVMLFASVPALLLLPCG